MIDSELVLKLIRWFFRCIPGIRDKKTAWNYDLDGFKYDAKRLSDSVMHLTIETEVNNIMWLI